MSIQIIWDDEAKTIIRWDVEGRWTWDEVYLATHEGSNLARSMPHRIDFIIHMARGDMIPQGSPLAQMRSLSRFAPDNWGVTVFCPANAFVRALHGVFCKVYPELGKQMLVAASLDDARQQIAVRRQSSMPEQG